MLTEQLVLAVLAAVAVGGLGYVFLYPILSGERQAEKRKAGVVVRTPTTVRAAAARAQQRSRREQVEETLKDLERRQSPKRFVPLQTRITQAGLSVSPRQFVIGAAIAGFLAFAVSLLIFQVGLIPALALGFMLSSGVPLWTLNFLKKRRESKFLDTFPDAVDVIVRGIKAGLPLLDGLKIVVSDSPEPIRSEFRTIIETQTIGMPLGDACMKLYERIPVAEANFFGIVIAIQQRAGGNLSEALGNLSRVLRERKKMKQKIQAMSMEAKASAVIIAALPIAVMLLVWLTSPDYISLLWTEPSGRVLLAMSAAWMSTGVFIMKKMINFDF